jgi:ABC-type protease/lipase transport system fused ATPase/permease subunit
MVKEKSKNILDKALSVCKQRLWVVAFFSLFINLLMFVAPLHMLQMYDRVLTSKSEVTLVALTVLAVGLLMIYGLLEGVRSRILIRAGLKFDELLNERIFRTIFRAAIVDKGKTGLTQALRDMEVLKDFLSGAAMIALCDTPWVPISSRNIHAPSNAWDNINCRGSNDICPSYYKRDWNEAIVGKGCSK